MGRKTRSMTLWIRKRSSTKTPKASEIERRRRQWHQSRPVWTCPSCQKSRVTINMLKRTQCTSCSLCSELHQLTRISCVNFSEHDALLILHITMPCKFGPCLRRVAVKLSSSAYLSSALSVWVKLIWSLSPLLRVGVQPFIYFLIAINTYGRCILR